jgi:hypothetical protein
MVNPRRNARQEASNDHNQQGQDQTLDNGQALYQVLAMKTQFMQTVMQAVTAMQQQQVPPPPPPLPQNRLVEFLRTRPLQLNVTRDLQEADDWFKAIEKNLLISQCTKREKVLFAAHQLYGPAADWWDAYSTSHLDAETIT